MELIYELESIFGVLLYLSSLYQPHVTHGDIDKWSAAPAFDVSLPKILAR